MGEYRDPDIENAWKLNADLATAIGTDFMAYAPDAREMMRLLVLSGLKFHISYDPDELGDGEDRGRAVDVEVRGPDGKFYRAHDSFSTAVRNALARAYGLLPQPGAREWVR